MKNFFIVLVLVLVPLIASAAFDGNLYYGLQNNNGVKEMQEFLTDQGVYSGPITGNFYSLTLKAVKDFQKKEKISPTSGFFGPLTRQKANDILSANVEPSNQQAIQETGSTPPPTEPAKTTNDVVKSLQDQIALLLQQVQAMQTQQTSVQQLQQTVQQQAETINQIQQNTQQTAQNTQQIAQNTTPPVRGCTSRTAENYNPSAVEDDGSCRHPDKTAPKVTTHYYSYGGSRVSWPDPNFPGYGNTHKSCINCIVIMTDEPTTASITYFNLDDLVSGFSPERKTLWDVPETNSKNQAVDGQLQAEPQRLLSFEDGLKKEHVISYDSLNLPTGVNYIYKFEVKDTVNNTYKQQFNGSYGLPTSWSLNQKIKKLPECQDSSLVAIISPFNPVSNTISKDYAGNIDFAKIKLSTINGNQNIGMDKLIITRDGGADDMFLNVSVDGGNLATANLVNGKAEFSGLSSINIPSESSRTITISAKLNPEKAVVGASVRFGITSATDITTKNVCDNSTSNATVYGSLMGNYMTIGE